MTAAPPAVAAMPRAGRVDPLAALPVAIGVVMPLVAAILYPTYIHQVQPAWAEWTRLMELPFVACELAFIHLATRRGYEDGAVWRLVPSDARRALGLLAIGLVASSVLVSKNVPASITLSLVTLVHLRFAAAVYAMVRARGGAGPADLFRWLGIGLVALTALTAWKFAFPPPADSVPGGRIMWPSAIPGFISVRHFGSWSGAIAAGAMVALLYDREARRLPTAALYLLAAGLTCWSGTRAAVLAMAVVALVMLVSLRRLPEWRAMALVAGLSLVAFAAAEALAPAGLSEFSLFARENMQTMNGVTSGRIDLWRETWARWREAPLFGWGTGSVFWEVDVGWSHTQPHNVILQFLISWGIVGAAGGLWLLGRAIGATHRTGTGDPALRPLTAMLHALLFMSLLEGMLHYPRFVMVAMLGFAVVLGRKHAGQPETATGTS